MRKGGRLSPVLGLLTLPLVGAYVINQGAVRQHPPSFHTQKGTNSMLNANGYTAAGAGVAADNISYALGSGNDANGNQFLRDAATGKGIVWNPSIGPPCYQLFNTVSAAGVPSGSYQYESSGGTLGTLPLNGWLVGNGASPAPTFTANAAPAAVQPAGVTATAASGLKVSINATNTGAQPGGTTYNLYESTTPGGEGATAVVTGIASLPYVRQETSTGLKYYTLAAVNGGTTSAQSAEVSAFAYNSASNGSNIATATAQVPAPGAVTGLTATLSDTGTNPVVTLNWALPTSGQAVTGINIREGATAGGESATPLNSSPLAASATSYVDSTGSYNQKRFYVIDTTNAGGTTTSAEVSILTDTAAPTNLTASPGNGVNNLAWTNAAGTIASIVYRALHGSVSFVQIAVVPNTSGTYADTSAVNGTAYDYQTSDLN